MSEGRDLVYVSYSYTDKEWWEKLQIMLAPQKLNIFASSSPGANWQKEIREKINTTKVAILFVTADYLAASFTNPPDKVAIEYPLLLEAAEKKALTLLPIVVGSCDYASLEILNYILPDCRPLKQLPPSKQEEALLKICGQIKESMSSRSLFNEEKERVLKRLAAIINDLHVPVDGLRNYYEDILLKLRVNINTSFYAYPGYNIPEILKKLDEITLSEHIKFPPLLRFVLQLSYHSTVYQHQLEGWLYESRAFWSVEAEDINSVKGEIQATAGKRNLKQEFDATIPSLLIVLESDGSANEKTRREIIFKVKDFWLHRGFPTKKAERPSLSERSFDLMKKSYTSDTVHELLESVLSDIPRKLSEKLRIEFFLPSNLFGHDIDRWEYDEVSPQGKHYRVVLGTKYPVVIRPSERLLMPSHMDKCKVKWKIVEEIEQNSHEEHEHVKWITESSEYNFKTVDARLNWEYVACFCFMLRPLLPRFTAKNGGEDKVFNAIIGSGVPIILWPKHPNKQNGDNWKQTLEPLLQRERLFELPEQILELRRKGWGEGDSNHIGRHIVLFWDDPTRIPPGMDKKQQFRVPAIKGAH